ncbi:MAG: hypothetical protein RDV48_05350 [Candidatus Eremiobacteraeota bacterium]|nr:hypothetical protein [Candidatus Eremiobacteraeota bacterium]
MDGIQKVFEQAGGGMAKGMEGLGEVLTAPLAKLKGDKKDDKEAEKSAAPVIINIINQAKGDESQQGGASATASASAVAGDWKQ